ncbi:MAG: TetR/AcrR family transcriptional regulator [Microlunatus sp.]|nr:TetR/AcrR family transcriptional regulator [Microlunatus sp.]
MSTDAATEPPITARRAQTRERLMAAARTVFADRGVEGASVEEICEAAGFSRGAFYSNFGDRSELVLAMIQQSSLMQLAAAQSAVATMMAAGHKDADELVSIALYALEGLGVTRSADETIGDRELMLHAARHPELHQTYLGFVDTCLAQVESLIIDGLRHAGLELTIGVRDAVALLAGTHQHLQTMAMFDSRRSDPSLLGTLLGTITRPHAGSRPYGVG